MLSQILLMRALMGFCLSSDFPATLLPDVICYVYENFGL